MSYFSTLNYSLGDEDNRLEQEVAYHSENVLCIAGSGTRAIPLLLNRPRYIDIVDISPYQLALSELRIEAIRSLSYAEYISFMGYACLDSCVSNHRLKVFNSLRLSDFSQKYLNRYFTDEQNLQPIYFGRFEKTLLQFSKFIQLVCGKNILALFRFDELTAQVRYYYSENFPKKRWLTSLGVLSNSTLLNSILYRGEFPKKNIDKSAYSIYKDIFDRLFNQVLCRDSYFAQLLILGEIVYHSNILPECDEILFSKIKRCISDVSIRYLNTDFLTAIKKSSAPYSFLSLSDVPSFMPYEDSKAFMCECKNYLEPGAKIVFREHLRRVAPITHGYTDISDQFKDNFVSESTQLWSLFIYQMEG